MFIPNEPFFWESGVHGPAPVMWYGVNDPSGSKSPFRQAPPGAIYFQRHIADGWTKVWLKMASSGNDSDWVIGLGTGRHTIMQHVKYTDFVDQGDATGVLTLNQGIPVNATVVGCYVKDVVGFTGSTTCTLAVGDGSDVDRYCVAGLIDIFSTAAYVTGGTPSGTVTHATAVANVVLTATEDSDWGDVTAGSLNFFLTYEHRN